jgi:methyl-accepting chemotaxis protein
MEMAAISSTSGLQGVTQTAFQQLKLQQARQNADRAEQQARSLQIQAADAQREADRAEENARDLSVRSSRAQSLAGQARQGLAMIRSVNDMKTDLANVLTRVRPSANEVDGSSTQTAEIAPVINTSGQVTGTMVNTVA